MDRTVKSELIENWIEENGPLGIEKLALRSKISVSVIAKAKGGKVPKKLSTMRSLASALGVSEDILFPLRKSGNRAS